MRPFSILLMWILLIGVARADKTKVRDGPTYFGMCDASAAAAIGRNWFIVANDEDNVLRVFRRDQGGLAAAELDMNDHLRPDPQEWETDIEGATWLDGKIYWITSHGRNKDGELRTSRHRLFATEIVARDGRMQVRPAGKPYHLLVVDMLRAPQLDHYRLGAAAVKAPKAVGGLNIEGLTFTPQGHLWVGLRNPIPHGKALIIPVTNPEEILQGARAHIGEPIELDLRSHGIRSIEYVPELKQYVIVAGPPNSAARTVDGKKMKIALFVWSGKREQPPRELEVRFGKATPEAFVVYRDEGDTLQVQFFSDDGTREIDDKPCKKLKAPAERRFRTRLWDGLNLSG